MIDLFVSCVFLVSSVLLMNECSQHGKYSDKIKYWPKLSLCSKMTTTLAQLIFAQPLFDLVSLFWRPFSPSLGQRSYWTVSFSYLRFFFFFFVIWHYYLVFWGASWAPHPLHAYPLCLINEKKKKKWEVHIPSSYSMSHTIT